MSINRIENILIAADNVCDYIPALSTITNLVDLFQKCVVLPLKEKLDLGNHYYIHLNQKSFLRCCMLLVPVMGNIVIGIYDFVNRKYNNKEYILATVRINWKELEHFDEPLKNDRDIVLAATNQDWGALKHASESLRKDPDFMLAVIKVCHQYQYQYCWKVIQYASESLRENSDFMLAVIKSGNGYPSCWEAVQYASKSLRGNREFMLAVVNENGLALEYASEPLRNDKEVVLAAIAQNAGASTFVGDNLKLDS